MALKPARPLAPFNGEDIDIGRRGNRRQRRRGRGRPPQGGQHGRRPQRQGHRPPPQHGPPQQRRGPHRARSPQHRPMPPEDYAPYEEDWEGPEAEVWPDQELALAGRFRRRFTTKAQLSPELELHAAEGTRAAVIPLRPGLYLVAEVSEQALSPNMGGTEVGAVAIATAAMTAARAALNIRQRRQEQGKEPLVRELRDRLADGTLRERLQVVRDRMQSGQGLVARFRDGEGPLRDRLFDHPQPGVTIPAGEPGELLPEPIPAWAEPEDRVALAGLIGCCRCRGGRRCSCRRS